jgi:hypothetical protein
VRVQQEKVVCVGKQEGGITNVTEIFHGEPSAAISSPMSDEIK